MRLRWVFWSVLLALHLFAVVFPPEPVAPAVGGSVYLPLMVLDALGLPVYQGSGGGGWASPSLLGWTAVAIIWAAVWWGVVSLVARLGRPRPHSTRPGT